MDLLQSVNDILRQSRASAKKHSFFTKLKSGLSDKQTVKFATQWYLAAKGHKLAFPYLVAVTTDDEIRFDLIAILRDEYGNGNRSEIHARMLSYFLQRALGIPERAIEKLQSIVEIAAFTNVTLSEWRDGEPVEAFGYHYALEFIAAEIHPIFAHTLQAQGFTTNQLQYFLYHREAENRHAHDAEKGIRHYAADPQNHQTLQRGALKGIDALENMWSGFERYVYS